MMIITKMMIMLIMMIIMCEDDDEDDDDDGYDYDDDDDGGACLNINGTLPTSLTLRVDTSYGVSIQDTVTKCVTAWIDRPQRVR